MAKHDAGAPPTRLDSRPRVGRPRGPSARVRAAVVDAVSVELMGHGLAGLNVERVAARAGVARATVYAHWPTRKALVIAATAEWHVHRLPVPDRGSWPQDLEGLVTALADAFSRPQ